MAIQFIGSSLVYKGTNLTIVPPSGTQPGDLLLFVVDGSLSVSTGVSIGTAPNISYLIALDGVATTGTFTASTGQLTGICLVYRGTNGLPKLASSATITPTASATNTAATPTSLGDWLVNIWGSSAGTAATLTTASGTIRADIDPDGTYAGLLISDQAPNSTASVAGVNTTASAAVIDQQSRVLLEEARVPYSLGSSFLKSTTSLTLDPTKTPENGDTVFVSFITSATPTALTVSDSGGNTYTLVASVALNNTAANGTLYLYASYRITNRIVSGFTVTSSNAVLMAISAWGVNAAANLGASQLVSPAVTAFGSSTAPTAQKTGLLTTNKYWAFGIVGTNGPSGDTFTQATGYLTPPVRTGTTGGAATTNRTIAGGWDEITISTAKNYAPTLGTSRAWGEIFVVYRYGTETSGVTTENIGISATESSTATINYNYVATHGESPGNTYYEYVNSPAQSYVTQIAWDTLRGLGTSFQANTTGPVGRVSLHLVPIGGGVYPGNYAIELYPVSSKTGTVGSLIASSQFSLASITADAIYHFSFEGTGASVTAGQWYVVAIKAPTDSLSTVRFPYVFVSNDQGVEESYYTEQINQSAPFILNNTGTWVYDNTRWPLKVSVYGNTIQDIVNGTTPGIAAPITESATGTDVSTQIKSSIAQHSEATSGVYYNFLNTLAPTALTSITWTSVRGTGVSFQAKTTGAVGSVALNLASVGSGAYPSNYTVELYSASSRTGAIGSLIASKEFALQSITTAGVYEFSFEGTGASVTAGQWYLVAIKAPTDSTTSARYLFVSLAGGAPGFEQYSNEQFGQSGVYSFNNSSVWEYDTGFAALKVAVYGTDTTLDSPLGGLTLTSSRTETGTSTESSDKTITTVSSVIDASSPSLPIAYNAVSVFSAGIAANGVSTSKAYGVTFKATSTYALKYINLRILRWTSGTASDATIEIWTASGYPSSSTLGSLLGSVSVPYLSLNTSGDFKSFDLSSTGVTLTANQEYTILFRTGSDWNQAGNYASIYVGGSDTQTYIKNGAQGVSIDTSDMYSLVANTPFFSFTDTPLSYEVSSSLALATASSDETITSSESSDQSAYVSRAWITDSNNHTYLDTRNGYSLIGSAIQNKQFSEKAYGFTFQANKSGQVGTVFVNGNRNQNGNPAPLQPLRVTIWNADSVTNLPTTELAGLDVPFTSLPNASYSTIQFNFSSIPAAQLISGNKYAITLEAGSDWDGTLTDSFSLALADNSSGKDYVISAYNGSGLYKSFGSSNFVTNKTIYVLRVTIEEPEITLDTTLGALDTSADVSETGTTNDSSNRAISVLRYSPESTVGQKAVAALDLSIATSFGGGAFSNSFGVGVSFIAPKSGRLGDVRIHTNVNTVANPIPTTLGTVELWQLQSLTGQATSKLAEFSFAFPTTATTTISPALLGSFSNVSGADVVPGTAYAVTVKAGSDWGGSNRNLNFWGVDTPFWNYYTNSVAGTYASVSIFGANDGNNSFNTSRIPVYDVEYATLTVDSLSGTYNPSVTRTEAATANTVTDWVQIDYTPQSVLYWVGGSGTMSGSSSGNWATTSGGSPTFFVPSAITDVYFDGNSDNGTPFTVTIGNTTCKSITVSGLDQPLTMTGAGALICYGGVTLPSSNFTSTYTGSITYRGEGRFNLDYNSNNFGGAVTFGSTTQNDYVSNDTAQILGSNYGLDANNIGNYVYVVGSSVGSYTLDGSTWTQRAAPFGSSSSATINSPTQVLVGSGVGSTIFVLSPTAEPTTATSYVGPASFYSSGTYGNNLYVFIAGSSGTLIYTSSTGTASSWTLRYTSPAVLTDVIWTGSQFIAVGSNGRVVTSSDGITWTDRITTTNTTDSLLAVASNGTTHVAVGNTGRIITSTDGINWTVQSSGTTNNLSEVAYGNNMFVAAGALGSYRYSSDGVTWTPVSVTTSAVNSLFFVNGKFWGVGNTNHTVSSTDGITWTNNTKNVSTIYSIAYNPATNLAVTVGGNGYTHRAYIDSSTSNLNYWTGTIGSTGTTNALNGVAYGAGLYVAVGAAGTIITSPDGITWTPRTSNTSQTLNDIVWSGDKFVAVGNTSAIRTSTDGITWNTASVTGVSSILRVAYNGTLFVAVGGSGNIKTSTDGTTWDTQTAATGFTSTTWQGICWNSDDNIFVIAGTSSSINWSSDGITWNNIESKPSGTVALTALAYYRGLYLAGGTSGLCWSSYDGLNWVARTSQNQNVQNIIGIPNKNRVFFCLSSGELDIGTVNTSSYKIASPTTFSGGITQSVGGIIVNSNLTTASYAIVTNTTQARGLKLQSGVTLDLNSTGTVWSYVTTDSINSFNSTGANILLSDNTTGARAFNGGTKSYDLVTIGGLTSTSNTTFSGTPTFNTLTTNKTVAHTISFNTADITRVANWNIQGTAGNVVSLRRSGTPALTNYILSVPTVGAPSTPYDIIYGQSELVAVGSSGAVRTSYDGINWTTRTSGVSVTLYGVAYNGSNMHVAVGAGGVIITSPDGITWNSRTSGTTNQLNDVCWAGTQFLAVGNTGTIITSPDGITWTTQTISGLTANLLRCGSSGSYHMLGGVGGVLYRGSDITNIAAWTSDSNAGGVNVTEIAYGNGYFVIGIATSSNGNVKYTSNNGTSWLGASTGVGGPTVDKIVWCPAFNGWAAISSGSYIYLCTSSIPSSFGYYSTVRTYSVGYGRNQVVFLTAAATAHLINANYQIVKV